MTGIIPPVTIIKQGLDKKDKTDGRKFLLTAAPKDSELEIYAKVLRRHGCTNLVRTYVPVYPSYPGRELHAFFLRQGITLHDLEFEDGSVPPPQIINQWFQLLQQLQQIPRLQSQSESTSSNNSNSSSSSSNNNNNTVTIAIHCMSGLSCAPVLIALALIDPGAMSNLEAISLLRHHRRGCLNHKQIE